MKTNSYVLTVLFLALSTLFTGCGVSSTGPKVSGKNSYTISYTEGAFPTSTGRELLRKAKNESRAFCNKKNMEVKVIDEYSDVGPYVLGNYPDAEITFSCVSNNDDERTPQVVDNKFDNEIELLLSKYAATKKDNTKWLFIISIEDYDDTDNVIYAKHSAEMFEKVAQKTLGISKRNTYSLINNRATSGRIKDRLRMLIAEVKEGDKIYFYYVGHGIPDPSDNGQPYILPSDKLPSYINQDKFFSLKNIYSMLDNSNADEVIAFVDSCFSGSTDGQSVLKGVASSRLVPKSIKIDKSKMTVMTAGSGTEFANMYEEKNHRLFSYYLMKSLLNGDKDIYTIYKKVSADVYHQSNIMGPLYRQEPVLQGSKKFEL